MLGGVVLLCAVTVEFWGPLFVNFLGRDQVDTWTRRAAVEVRNGISNFASEYRRLPLQDQANGSDLVVKTDGSSGLVALLLAAPDHEATARYNPRRILFFSWTTAKTPQIRGLVRAGDGFRLNDSRGQPFLVYLDTNNDGSVEVPNPRGAGTITLFQSVAVVSTGRDKVLGPKDGRKSDDLATY